MDEARILFVTRKWAPAVGGMETYSMRLAEAMQAIEPVEVVALPGKPDGMPPGAPALLSFPFRVMAALLRRRRMPEILHLGDMAIWPLALLPRLFFANTRIALSAHGTDVAYHRRGGVKGRAYGAYLRLGARLLRGARVIANSRATVEAVREVGWPHATRVPLATDRTAPPVTGKHNDDILFIGRLVERKGCRWFIENVLDRLPENIHLRVIGTGWDPAEISALNHPRVKYMGRVPDEILVEEIRQALCVVMPNIPVGSGDYEGFGIIALEVAAVGGILLAARSGGLTDAVIDGGTGFLLTPGSADAWVDAIAKASAFSVDARKKFSEKARALIEEQYRWRTVAQNTYVKYGFQNYSPDSVDRNG